MKLRALDIPDDPEALGGWLDGHVAGLDLADLVAELEAVHGPDPAGAEPLDGVLGNGRAAVLERGLAVLPHDRLRPFLLRPRLLLDLQALVLREGGDYWRRLELRPEHRALVDRGRARLAEFVRGGGALPAAVAWHRRSSLRALAVAASLLAVVVGYRSVTVAPVGEGWGWARPGALPQGLSPAAYLDTLADDAGEWFRQRPEGPAALARRLGEFRAGCSALILAEHRPLSADNRTWLIDKCRAWAGKIDKHLADVEAGVDPRRVRDQADETVNALVKALRARGGQVSRGEAT